MVWLENESSRPKALWKTIAYIYFHLSDDIYVAGKITFHDSLTFIHPRSSIFSLLYV